MKTTIVLRNESKATGLWAICIEYSNYPKIKRFGTPFKVLKKHFDSEGQKIKKGGVDNHAKANETLKTLQASIEKLISDYHAKHLIYPTCEQLSELHHQATNPKQEKDFYDYYNEFIEAKEKEKKRENTIKNFRTLLINLKAFTNKQKVTFETISYKFFENFTHYLISQTEKDDETGKERPRYKNTTIQKKLKNFKEFLTYCYNAGYHANLSYKLYSFRPKKMKSNKVVALTVKEIKALTDLNLTGNKRLEQVRDLFILQCWLGVRYSDLMQIRKHNINLITNRLTLTTIKTEQDLSIPIFPEALRILEKYDFEPKQISNAKYNAYLKEVCQLVPELCAPESHSHYTGSERVADERTQRWEYIGTHTARRTFNNLMINLSEDRTQVRQWTGHTTEAMQNAYTDHQQTESKAIEQILKNYNAELEALNN